MTAPANQVPVETLHEGAAIELASNVGYPPRVVSVTEQGDEVLLTVRGDDGEEEHPLPRGFLISLAEQ